MVLSIGDITYKEDAKAVLEHYFKHKGLPYTFIESIPDNIDTRGSHPSWWKLLAHRILPGYDFIICWDLDLLPISLEVDVIQEFDMSKICMAWDSSAKYYPVSELKSFKYNGGLIGIPKSYSHFTEYVLNTWAPGVCASYEQYYLNQELYVKNIDVHELPSDINVLFSYPEFWKARLQHYTAHKRAKEFIELHRENYFKKI